ncbi:hypothetical protein [Chamaesiphon minutus]|uniref:Lipoprotein n=1 Tax=Chamaesiphon minutus (strain ATCC 27169 / PCC 6605) TaxID=1173020 RepID=K9UF23_CHAP6|nr:hypothetical protein [Chamaesiphon minutus]AFY93031.1 hypothetical protein Cha6605_1924 [Chamaesiphon minutus PCC 6605]
MQVSQKIFFLAALIGILGISSCARTSTPNQAQVDKSTPTQQPQANKQIDVTTPVEATDEAKEREREVQDEQVPTSLTNVGNYGEALYDTAKAGDWTKASANLKLLQQVTGKLPAEIAQKDVARLKLTTTNLNRSITAKNKSTTLQEANQVTLIAARMTTEFKPKVPVEVTLLDYYGREFEILSASGNKAQLTKTAAEFQQTWNTLRPATQARNSSEAKTFDAIAARIQAAKSPAEYGRLATPVLDAVDKLEKVFL